MPSTPPAAAAAAVAAAAADAADPAAATRPRGLSFPPSSPGFTSPAKSWRAPLSPLPLPLSLMLLITALAAAAAAAAAAAWWRHGAEVVATCPAADASLHPGMPLVQAQLDELRAELARLAAANEALRAQLSSENVARERERRENNLS